MSFLKYDKEKDKVYCTEEGFVLKEVKEVFANDRTGKEKAYFNEIITAIYWIYNPVGIYSNKSIRERTKIVNKDHLRHNKWEDLLLRKGVSALVKTYVDLSFTINEKLLDRLKDDADELLNLLSKIPVVQVVKLKKGAVIKDKDGESISVKIDQTIELPNIEEKKKAYENILLLSKTLKEAEKNLKIERAERDKEEIERRIFDEKEKRR